MYVYIYIYIYIFIYIYVYLHVYINLLFERLATLKNIFLNKRNKRNKTLITYLYCLLFSSGEDGHIIPRHKGN